jgi:uncharacterized protein (TIGR02145 family)
MEANLNIGTRIDGANDQTDNSINEKYCYDDDENNCDTYGGLYQWNEMMQYITVESSQGICPIGWHIPSDDDWKTLEMQLGMSSSDADNTGWRGTDEGSKIAGNEPLWTNGVLDQNANFGTSGFDALPAGYRYTDGLFYEQSNSSGLWTSNEGGSGAWRRFLNSDRSRVHRYNSYNVYGFSVRCIRD